MIIVFFCSFCESTMQHTSAPYQHPMRNMHSQRYNRDQVQPQQQRNRGRGRNSESFDPKSTWVTPDFRVRVLLSNQVVPTLTHDDICILPDFFARLEDWTLYDKLLIEMNAHPVGWSPWHEGLHLIHKNPEQSLLFNSIINRLCQHFRIHTDTMAVRFNWYASSTDWKAFHHDSAAFNAQRAHRQNITLGVSFGATRELAFLNAQGQRFYFPQSNGGVFTFGNNVNIRFKHGINACQETIPEKAGTHQMNTTPGVFTAQDHTHTGRISIIIWGWADSVDTHISPPLPLINNTSASGHEEYIPNHHRRLQQEYVQRG